VEKGLGKTLRRGREKTEDNYPLTGNLKSAIQLKFVPKISIQGGGLYEKAFEKNIKKAFKKSVKKGFEVVKKAFEKAVEETLK